MVIYKTTNKINGKSYIGQTTWSLDKRKYFHIYNALSKRDNIYFHKAIRKYSEENFIWEVITKCNSLEELNKAEVEMIEKYNTFENGYNLSLGGSSNAGYKHSEESRQKMSEAKKGKNNPSYGKHHSEETKKKMREAHKGDKNYMYGKHPTEETKKKMREAHMGEKNPNYKHGLSKTKEHLKEYNKKWYQDHKENLKL
jgi:group I intron endonuclease